MLLIITTSPGVVNDYNTLDGNYWLLAPCVRKTDNPVGDGIDKITYKSIGKAIMSSRWLSGLLTIH